MHVLSATLTVLLFDCKSGSFFIKAGKQHLKNRVEKHMAIFLQSVEELLNTRVLRSDSQKDKIRLKEALQK